MSEYKNKYDALDAFWDISSLVPSQRPIRAMRKSTSTVDITQGEESHSDGQNKLSDTVITRSIPSAQSRAESNLTEFDRYQPTNPLLHKVILYKDASTYDFYADFCRQAEEYLDVSGTECEFCEFFSYSPQYDQLTSEQRAYYFWWRECVRHGKYIKTNPCYVNLLFFELINVGDKLADEKARDMMIDIIVNYRELLKGYIAKYIKWIVDFSIIHRLSPPKQHSRFLVENAVTLKEYFVRVPHNNTRGWAEALLEYCCSYDYRTSKFAKDEALALFDTHVVAALTKVVEYLSEEGRILSALPFGDCKLTAKVFEGAICATQNRYTIEVEYCSFSRSHELRFLVGDIVKYCENKIRANIFVKSRLTVYSLPKEIQVVLDEYFDTNLQKRQRPTLKKQELHEYDVLYDVPKRALDLSNAARIENESWQTTRDLVDAFDEPTEEPACVSVMTNVVDVQENDELTLMHSLEKYRECLKALVNGDCSLLYDLSRTLGKPVEAVVDDINEISVEVIGDILVDDSEGEYAVIEDYREMIE